MKKIFSKSKPNQLLHLLIKKADIHERNNIIPEENFLQLATISLKKNQTFKAHKHIWRSISYNKVIAQESWVVVQGSVKVDYYDTDGDYIESCILNKGDCTVTLFGGHNYTALDDDTLVYEFKTGPYEGIEKDKEFI